MMMDFHSLGKSAGSKYDRGDMEVIIPAKARVRYFGWDLPMEFALCLRMRQNSIKSVTTGSRKLQFERFKDDCSTFVYVPIVMEKAGTVEIIVKHPAK